MANAMSPGMMRGWVDFIAGIPVATAFKAAVSFLAGITVTGTTTTTTATVTGNETVGGTLGVTGATTLSSTLGVTGAATTGQITHTQPATGTKTLQVVGIAGSTVNLWEMNATAIANAENVYGDKNGHLAIAQALPPTGVLGTGAGTGAGTAPVLTITGTDQRGIIQVVTGTQVPVAGAAIVTMTFKTTMTTAPWGVNIGNANGSTQALARAADPVPVSATTTGWVLFAGTAALAISTTYQWSYWCL